MTNPLLAFYIDYPVERVQGKWFQYRCSSCKKLTKEIQGKIENHGSDCKFRLSNPKASLLT